MADNEEDLARSGDPRVGKTLGGKWKLDRLIGVGGMASVYAASHRNGALAAIKILSAEYARRTDVRTRFLREAYIANKAGKGAVAVLDDDVDDDGAPYLIMELLTGEPVDVRTERMGGRLPVQDVLWVTTEMLSTLEFAHQNGIIHRDLKPENLFWTADNRIKVLDFGIARLHDASNTEQTRAGMVMGTPGFMAPEQALGAPEDMDARTDIWGVGAIMFRLLTGREVHPEEGNLLVIAATRKAPPVSSYDPHLPPEVASIVDRALEFSREDRYSSAREMRENLERITKDNAAPIPSLRYSAPRVPIFDATAATQFHDKPQRTSEDEPAKSERPGGLATGMSDDDTLALRDLLGLIALAVRSRLEFGPAHPQTVQKLETAYRFAIGVLANAHIGLFWNVMREGFATNQGLLWMAKPPLAPTPAQMFDGGVRMLGLLPELTREEFSKVVGLVGGDIAPFTDYATFLQSAQLEHLVYRIDAIRPDTPARVSASLSPPALDDSQVPAMLEALATADPAMRAALLSRLERRGDGYEPQIGAILAKAGAELAIGLLRVLSAVGTDAARQAMLVAIKSEVPIVRIDALSKLDAADRLRSELRAFLEAADPRARLGALVEIEKYRIKAAGPALVLRIKSSSFDTLPLDERRQALSALGALLPSRAETIAMELLQDQRIISNEAHELTRELACQMLGKIAVAPETEQILEAALKSRWRSSERVRAAAAAALANFIARAVAPTPRPSVAPRRSTPPKRSVRPARPPSPSKRPPAPGSRPSKRPPKPR